MDFYLKDSSRRGLKHSYTTRDLKIKDNKHSTNRIRTFKTKFKNTLEPKKATIELTDGLDKNTSLKKFQIINSANK